MMVLVFVSIFLNQLILSFLIFIMNIILSTAGLPKTLKIQRQEAAKQLQRRDFSEPIKFRDFLFTAGRLKLAYKLGKKYILFMWLFMIFSIGGLLFIMNSFWLKLMNTESIITYSVGFNTLHAITSYFTLKTKNIIIMRKERR